MLFPVCALQVAFDSKLHEFVVRPCIDHPTLLYRELEDAEEEEDIERGGDDNILRGPTHHRPWSYTHADLLFWN